MKPCCNFTQTGALTNTGAEVHRAFLRIESLLLEDAGPYRCRVDFKQAPTRNVKFRLELIGEFLSLITLSTTTIYV